MSSILRIQENMTSLSEVEKKIAAYIIKNPKALINESAQTVAQKTKTSASAVVRASKSLGYSGFTDLKLNIAQDLKKPIVANFDEMIKESDSYEMMLYKAQRANEVTFSKTYQLLDPKNLEAVVKTLIKAHTIYLVGLGGSSIAAQDLYHKLTRIDKKCVYTEDFHMFLTALTHITEDDVVILFSYSGLTKEAILAQKHAQSIGAKSICITSNKRTILSQNADHTILIPREEKELRLGAISSRFAFLAISDLMYFGVAKEDLKGVSEKLLSTRELLKDMSQ